MPDPETPQPPDEFLVVATGDYRAYQDLPPKSRIASRPWFWLVLALFIAGYASMFVVSPQLKSPYGEILFRFACAGLEVLPLVPLILFATLGREIRAFRFVALAYWLGLAVVGVLGNTFLTGAAVIDADRFRDIAAQPPEQRRWLDAFPPGHLNQVVSVMILSIGSVIAGLLGFFESVRQRMSRWVPMDPASFPDAVSLATTIAITLGCVVPLFVLRQPPMLLVAKNFPDELVGIGSQASLFDMYARLYWMLPVAFLAAGWPLIRDFPSALRRLGLVMPSRGQWLVVPLGTVFLIGLMRVVERGIGTVWTQLGLPVTDEKTFEQLMNFAKSLTGAIAIGITAGFWEEVAFRGVLQPRIGLWPANLLFTAMHAQQYHLDGLLNVFLIGLILGRIRDRTNTTTAALIHGLYDCLLVLAWTYHWPGFSPDR